ncbi:hypothetical protein F2Q69_00059390 [Brassica cretica]|uniref:Uncharacterized protein n=1 Tax=Brassica cretica TaxID=69181 RepID=A0A8S9RLC6_BRACR|nr:hypothetical protein F2Q69_00059390 [Brassica cretica]
MHGFVSYRHFGKVRSLRSDRAVYVLGRYVATELGRYVATELGRYSLRSDLAWLDSDRAVCVLSRYVVTELGWSSVAK